MEFYSNISAATSEVNLFCHIFVCFMFLKRSPKSVAKVINLAVPALESELPDLMSDFLTETCEADSVHDVIFEV